MAQLAAQNLTMFRGDTPSFNLVVTTDGAAQSLTGATLRMTAKYSTDDLDAAKVFAKTIGSGITVTNAGGGLATVLLAASDTSGLPSQPVVLFYDIEMTTNSNANIYTIAYGTLTVLPDISITVP